MSLVEHLEDLRRVLIVSLAAWLVAAVGAFIFHDQLLTLLLRPLTTTLNSGNHLIKSAIFTSPTEGLTIPIKLSAIAGAVIALPIVLWQVWGFVSPGLRPAERKFAAPFIASALLLFATGCAFAYFVMPIGLNFLISFLGDNAQYFPDINEYLSFFMLLIFVFGITFELPIVILMLGLFGIVSSKWLRARRKGAWVIIIAASLIVTPGADPFTPTLLLIPLILLYEASVLILAKGLKR